MAPSLQYIPSQIQIRKLLFGQSLDALERLIQETGSSIVAIDPVYLAMPGGDAGNVFIQGEMLGRVNRVCERNGAGLILAHHTTRTSERQGKNKPPELDDIAWAGFPEWARQWLLLGRREAFVPGSGNHDLWLNVGGSAGHSSLWAVDISEGRCGLPRHWKVAVSTPSEICEEKEKKKAIPLRERILEAAGTFPAGDSMSGILAKAKIKHDKKASEFFSTIVKEGELVECQVKKKGGTVLGYRLAGSLASAL